MPDDSIHHTYKNVGPIEGTVDHQILEKKSGFAYRTLLGEMMYAYVTCRPAIGSAITTLSKFSSKPHVIHYAYLKGVAKLIQVSAHYETMGQWGIRFKRSVPRPELPL